MVNDKFSWKHSLYKRKKSNINLYKNFINKFYTKKTITNYEEMWIWSVEKTEDFWRSIFEYYLKQKPLTKNILEYNKKKPFYESFWFKDDYIKPYSYYILQNVISNKINKKEDAIIYKTEGNKTKNISWGDLYKLVLKAQTYLLSRGVKKGSRVVSVLNNGPEAVIYFLATNSLGAIWSSCSPDFGAPSITERFKQIKPDILIATKGYSYNGKYYSKKKLIDSLKKELPSLKDTLIIDELSLSFLKRQKTTNKKLFFENINFNHPIWILYSSGTTGNPKAITHSNGGMLLEHYKALGLHQECVQGDRFFWFSTTGWMMWNYSLGSMLHGCTLVLYDGSPGHPSKKTLWQYAKDSKINHFGGGASYFISCMKNNLDINLDFEKLKSIGSTGSPLTEEAFLWLKNNIKKDIWIVSLSGGTDVCTAFVGGCSEKKVYAGEIQCKMLGADVIVLDEMKKPVINQVGEMFLKKPMPCMPIYFWNDKNNQKYKESYFKEKNNFWRHGDWIKITKNKGVVIYGRSDATLNKGGVRLGTSEIYKNVDLLEEVEDSMIICIDLDSGKQFMPLFIKTKQNLTKELILKINNILRKNCSPRHVPDSIYKVEEIPYTISGKKMESPIKKILMGMDIKKSISIDAMKNPKSLDFFIDFQSKELKKLI